MNPISQVAADSTAIRIIDNMRRFADEATTEQLIEAIEDLESRGTLDDDERTVYAILCAAAAKRLSLDPKAVTASQFTPGDCFRLVVELRD